MIPHMFMAANNKQKRGFTLIEMLVVLAVVAILLSAAAPSFMSMIANNRVSSASNELVTALNIAKSEAIRSGQNAVLCKSSDGAQCNSAGEWKNGWLVFRDSDNDQSVDSGESIIRVYAAPEASLNINYYTGNYIKFKPNGGSNEAGRFCINNAYKQENSRAVIITLAGRVRSEERNSATGCDST